MSRQSLRVHRYRFALTFRRRWTGYLALVLLIGLLGGVAMGSLAAGRRTQSAYPTFLASTNPADLTFSTYGSGPQSAANTYSATLTQAIARLPQVRRVESWVGVFAAPLKANGAPDLDVTRQLNTAGSVDGLYFNEDRATAVEGRMARPDRPDEFVTTALGAHLLGLHVGQTVPMGFYGSTQGAMPGFGTAAVAPERRLDMKLVGLVAFNNEVVEDDADRLPTNVLFTPALTHPLLDSGNTQGTWYGLQLVGSNRSVPAVEQEINRLLPAGNAAFYRVTSFGEAKVESAVKPEAIAFGVFGAIAAVAALMIALLSISRQLREGDEDRLVLRALGAGPTTAALDGLPGILGAVVIGSLLACGVAVGLSPLSPLGPVRPVYPSRGFAIDWTVLALGLLVLVAGLGTSALALAYRGAPHRATRRSGLEGGRPSVAQRTASWGLPVSGVTGIGFALEPGKGRSAVPVRSVLFGGVLAVMIVTATVTFGSSLHSLVSQPALYGWNWSYALNSINDIPPQARAVLDHDRDVVAWTGEQTLDFQLDGQNVPVLLGDSHPALSPPILSGHSMDGRDQIVLGAATLSNLHKHIGDTVTVSFGARQDAPLYIPPTRLVIVGSATMPAVAGSSTLADHTSMGIGAVLSGGIVPPALLGVTTNPDPTLNGPGLVFVRLRSNVRPAAGLADMQRIADVANAAFADDPNGAGDSVAVLSVQHPAEIVNYRSTGATPVVLAGALAMGVIVALGLTLTASVRRRRRDLAILKTLGFTRGQLAAALAWQASITAAVAAIVGVPLGVAAGRWLWTLFAREIYAVPEPTVPLSSLILIALGSLVIANIVAAVPGRIAANTPAGLVLRTQ